MYEQQSVQPDQEKRKKVVWEIDRRLQEDAARPIIYQYRLGTCHSPRVHGITNGQQHLQRLAFRRSLARVTGFFRMRNFSVRSVRHLIVSACEVTENWLDRRCAPF